MLVVIVHTSFGSTSANRCHAISAFDYRICTSYVDPTGLTAYTARLIPLDKNPGVSPIGVEENCWEGHYENCYRRRTYSLLLVLPNCVLVGLGVVKLLYT